MHYYKRHIGDYAKKAGHLSILEHGVYTLLLDAYYDRNKPYKLADAIKIARARTPEEITAVKIVLADFFPRGKNKRADEELAAYQLMTENNQRIARERNKK